MDVITEEVLSSLIKRVDNLEAEVKNLKKNNSPKPQPHTHILMASTGQINYIRGLGGNPWPGMTKQEASNSIEKLLEQKKKRIPDGVETPEVTEPQEVDTDDAGIDKDGFL